MSLAASAFAVPGVMLRDDDLRASASAGAARLGPVKKGKTVEVLGNRGGWTQVRAGATVGWVRLLSVRRGGVAGTDYGASLGSAQGAVTTPHDTGTITATSGLRGLDVADLSAAKYDAAQLDALERQGVTRAEAEAFAARAALKAHGLAYLPDPAARPASGAGYDLIGGP
jgi:hypothetical protein